jgi:hypothetical protein
MKLHLVLNWVWRFLNLKKCTKTRIKRVKNLEQLAQTLNPMKPPKEFTMSKSGLQILLKWKNHTTLVDTWNICWFWG